MIRIGIAKVCCTYCCFFVAFFILHSLSTIVVKIFKVSILEMLNKFEKITKNYDGCIVELSNNNVFNGEQLKVE